MFINFFYHLRQRGIPVSTTEFFALLEALEQGLAQTSLERFYLIARAVLVKKVEHFDLYDAAFYEFFKDRPFAHPERRDLLTEDVLNWLQDPRFLGDLSPAQRAHLEALDLDELRALFEQRLAEQKERHDGGSHWVGTGGTSPFGHGGHHPSGIGVGGRRRRGSALQIASRRRFQNLRTDRVLDTRQIALALKKLRRLTRDGRADELDLEATIDATANNGGQIDLVFRPPRKNEVKLLLLADVGGSMNPHTDLTSRLFSAAHKAHHFKAFKTYYFHNCPYETLYTDMARRQGVSTRQVLANLDRQWRCFIIGDAAMAPPELIAPGGCIDYYHFNDEAGITWLQRIADALPRTVWLNPDNPRWWGHYTTELIGRLFPMFPLTLQGLHDAIEEVR